MLQLANKLMSFRHHVCEAALRQIARARKTGKIDGEIAPERRRAVEAATGTL